MIYISSACVKHARIKDSIEELVHNGFKNIELSGGTKYYAGFEDDLLRLKERHGLHYLVHNYFPPPMEDFVLNLASLNDRIYQQSLTHCLKAVALAQKLGSDKFSVHAGFYIDFTPQEAGKPIALTKIASHSKAINRFCDAISQIKAACRGIDIYVENNVLSKTNINTFQGQNPFMMTDYAGYLELRKHVEFKLLFDIAHMHVSAHSLGLGFAHECHRFLEHADYIHASHNDGLHDFNLAFEPNSAVLKILKDHDYAQKTVTLEIYGTMSELKASHVFLESSLGNLN